MAFGLLTDARHANRRGVVHGGMLVTLMDHALGAVVWEAVGRAPIATIQLDAHFLAAVRPGEFVEARGQVVRRTRSVVFVRGALTAGGREVLAASGIWKVLGGEEPRQGAPPEPGRTAGPS